MKKQLKHAAVFVSLLKICNEKQENDFALALLLGTFTRSDNI